MTAFAMTRGRAWLERQAGGPEDRRRTARRLVIASGVLVLLCTAGLLADHAVGVWRTAGQDARIVDLEGRTKEDAEAAAVLHAERKGRTDSSLAREGRGRVLAWMLLLSGGVLVAAGKWWVSLRPARLPALEELVAVRFGDVAGEMKSPGRHLGRDKGGRGEGAGAEAIEAAGARGEGDGNGTTESVDREFLDGLIDRFGHDREAAIPILQAIQSHFRYLPDEALRHVCERTEITPAQITGTSSFYAQFRRSPVGRYVVRVCHGTACHVAGAERITDELRRHLEIPPGADTDPQRLFTIDEVACLGCCSLAPVMMIEEDTAGRLTPATARQALDAMKGARRT